MLADDDIYFRTFTPLVIRKCVLTDARIVINNTCFCDKWKAHSVHSLDWRVQQHSCFVVSCNTNSFLIILHILHCAFLLSGNSSHLLRLFSGAIHRLFTCVGNIRLSIRCISLCSNSRKSGLLVILFDHAGNFTRLVTNLTADLIMIYRWTQSWPASLFGISYVNP